MLLHKKYSRGDDGGSIEDSERDSVVANLGSSDSKFLVISSSCTLLSSCAHVSSSVSTKGDVGPSTLAVQSSLSSLTEQHRHPSPPSPAGRPLSWVKQAIAFPEDKLNELRGIDATLYIRFLRGCCTFKPRPPFLGIKSTVFSLVHLTTQSDDVPGTVPNPSPILRRYNFTKIHDPCFNIVTRKHTTGVVPPVDPYLLAFLDYAFLGGDVGLDLPRCLSTACRAN